MLAAALVLLSPAGDALVRKIEALKSPAWNAAKAQDAAFQKRYMGEYAAYTKRRNALILKLYATDPSHPKAPGLMEERWTQFESGEIGDHEGFLTRREKDVLAFLNKNPKEPYREIAWAARADIEVERASMRAQDPIPAIARFRGAYPKSARGERLYLGAFFSASGPQRTAIAEELIAAYPMSKMAVSMRGVLRQEKAVGQPFALRFTDAVSSGTVDLSEWKGKVVLIDFWATWCGPCVAKLPELKALYREFHSQGLEIVGVSLDEPAAKGGLKALKTFVAKHEIPWPQYHQGNGWESEFSSGWGILSIPTVFLVDKAGRLRETNVPDAREAVERLLKE